MMDAKNTAHLAERFFLDNFEFHLDHVFHRIQRADYLVLYSIQARQDAAPGEKVYLSDLAEGMGLQVTELSCGVEKLQDKGFLVWKTDREAGRSYLELSSKAIELMAAERERMKRSYQRLRTELGDEELSRTVTTMRRIAEILQED